MLQALVACTHENELGDTSIHPRQWESTWNDSTRCVPQDPLQGEVLEPSNINRLKMSCPANGFILGEGLIGIGHDLKE